MFGYWSAARKRLSRRLLPTTKTDEKAMAAPAHRTPLALQALDHVHLVLRQHLGDHMLRGDAQQPDIRFLLASSLYGVPYTRWGYPEWLPCIPLPGIHRKTLRHSGPYP
ncbi:hypothetical protein M878_19575 [Streptomyces roseochromogenus subsp. oscitans DS 12.976]|uniref:Uncharacterized protein n=1 Tax=Streptomyces roseochromogenus subsp. oscitans DS 12.976 TaxID=1352936 RepID=V6KET0_STRRC|nr:hypothetical protein M878_19575 [Streptomyces roseochromogenus subsp. oscitans DS 12.976]